MPNVLWAGIGGFIGSVLRYILSGLVQDWTGREDLPVGTLAVNLIGCLIVGLLSQLAEDRGAFSPQTRVFLVIGILGGFTTFSAFGNETMNLLRHKENLLASVNIVCHIVLGLGMVWLGRVLGHLIWR
jgi:CrcB protein